MTTQLQLNGATVTAVPLDAQDIREGLRLERALALAHDLMHAAENDLNRYVAHVGAVYGVPDGWKLNDWLVGFVPPTEGANDG